MIDNKEENKKRPQPVNFHRKLRALEEKGLPVPDFAQYPGDRYRLVIKNQLLVLLDKPLEKDVRGISLLGEDVRDRKKKQQNIPVRVKRVCHCNTNLVLLEGNDVHFLTGEIEVTYSPDTITPPPKINTSSANDIRYSPDTITPPPKINTSAGGGGSLPITPASHDDQLRRIDREFSNWKTFPVVAVMDTGIDFAYPKTAEIPILYNGGTKICDTFEHDYIGWDFVHDHNVPYDDDDRNKHGSRIAAIISREMNNEVRILPLKVIDSLGIGTLFDIFCGFEYVLSAHLKEKPVVINASWGFYSEIENQLMTDYMRRLKRANIWLINAAGNRGDIEAGRIKDLKKCTRFPACYSRDHANVITITTVANTQLVGGTLVYEVAENFSSTFVNAGVGSGSDSKFREPLIDGSSPSVKGSSYATPHAVAYATKAYRPPVDDIARENLLASMPSLVSVDTLRPVIKDGLFVPVEND